jgi:2-polyprenyl-3-methyl-5-hydroxy-6-metoxy-1,4-benzoquinol methylase
MPARKKQPLVENGIVVGTSSGKYELKNPIARYLLNGFDNAILELAHKVSPETITEVGCGEGHVTRLLLEATQAKIQAMDISDRVLGMARKTVSASNRVVFENRSIYDLNADRDQADLVVCCEVLEHLEHPRQGLELLAASASPYALLSVPREPIFRSMNFVRGAYFMQFGNSPGHIQHWSRRGFVDFVSSRFDIREVRSPLPWTMLLVRSRRHS